MKKRYHAVACAIALVLLVCPGPAGAHLLDEYLQAARFSIQRGGVGLELDLTPGISVAPAVWSLIDTNRDGLISNSEAMEYAQQVLKSIDLYVDKTPIPLKLDRETFPELSAMNAGTGIIRLRAYAKYSPLPAGRHELFYRNLHQPEISVYLANALVPEDKQIKITAQRRDTVQQELAIEYRVSPGVPGNFEAWLLAALAAGGIILVSRRGRGPKGVASQEQLLRQEP